MSDEDDERPGLHRALNAVDDALRFRFGVLEQEIARLRRRVDYLERPATTSPTGFTLYIADQGAILSTATSTAIQIHDDDLTKSVILIFTDAKGSVTSDPTAAVTFTSTAPGIATVGGAVFGTVTDPATSTVLPAVLGSITPVGGTLGVVEFSATVTNADGTVLTGSPVDVEIIAAKAAGFTLRVG